MSLSRNAKENEKKRWVSRDQDEDNEKAFQRLVRNLENTLTNLASD